MNATITDQAHDGVVPAPVIDRTIHNETNFKPEEYEVLEYLDNQPPKMFMPLYFFGMNMVEYEEQVTAARTEYEARRAQWNAEMDQYFPHRREEQPSIHKCTHCGNTQVRYIVAVRHVPTNQNVVFGDVCVERLGFANHNAFKAAQLRAKAAQGNASVAVYNKRLKFLDAHPDFKTVLDNPVEIGHPVHAKNGFLADILAKFNKYGYLSENQVNAFLKSVVRDHEFAARRAQEAAIPKGRAPTGRVVITGELVKVKTVTDQRGFNSTKMTLKLSNGARVYMTMPSSYDYASYPEGSKVAVRATITASRDDQSFGFGKRPTLISAEAPVERTATISVA